ncbi:hypothetical protein FACS1894120_2270 [Clostridia bacterium]|nr:hypothetical protein FACS1894120_2270 [Clostridia bacterium]
MPLIISVGCALLALSVLVYAFMWWGRYKLRMFLPMAALLFLQSLAEIMIRLADDEWEALTAFRFSQTVCTAVFVFLYLFAREYCDKPLHNPLKGAALFFIPALSAISAALYPLSRFSFESVDFAFDGQGLFISADYAPVFRLGGVYSLVMLSMAFRTFVQADETTEARGWQYVMIILGGFTAVTMALTLGGGTFTNRGDVNALLIVTLIMAWILAVFAVNRGGSSFRMSGRDYVLQKLGEPYILVNGKGGFLDANDAAVRIFPALSRLRIGTMLSKVPEIPTQITASADAFDMRLSTGDDLRYFHVSYTPLYVDKLLLGTGIMLFDVTGQHELMKAIKQLAQRDMLTGLYNQASFMRAVAQDYAMVRRGKYEASIVICSIENFDGITENLGYATGDGVILEVSKILSARLRRTDIIARYNNEQFIIWLPATPKENALIVVRSLQDIMSKTRITTNHVSLTVNINFGISHAGIPDPPFTEAKANDVKTQKEELLFLTQLLKDASADLSRAKENGNAL